jgi:ring-1,2-phenylacetyl-CoA epoxidase subunit PaaC
MTDPMLPLLLAMADDELMLGHRDAEWTGHAPILEEDIAFSNIAQDELGHALLWYTLHGARSGSSPDAMAFERDWQDFTCSRFVTYPKGDFAYTLLRQYFFDEAEQVRLAALAKSSDVALRDVAGKIRSEEAYHLLHVKGLVTRLGNATEESHRRMQRALDTAFPQALGLFEPIEGESELAGAGIFPGMGSLAQAWEDRVRPVLSGGGLTVSANAVPDIGGRRRLHDACLRDLVGDLQQVYRLEPGAAW